MNRTRSSYMLLLIGLLLGVAAELPAQHYAAENGWSFINFGTANLPWEIYRDTYIGIPPTRDPVLTGFDVLFYDQVYQTELAGPGNCYGMSLMSLLILQKGSHLGFCSPVPQYSGDIGFPYAGPTDSRLLRAINQMHGHQVNLPTLRLFLEIIAKGKNRNGTYAYDQVNYYKLQNDPTLVNITKSLLPTDGGHTMVAYDAKEGGGQKRIYVYDPNRTWGNPSPSQRGWYESNRNYITIDSLGSGSWIFHKGGTEYQSGSPSSGGNITITPISITGPTARSPSSLGLSVSDLVTTVFISGEGAALEQVTDAKGKRLFKPGAIEVDINPATGMLNMLPWYPSDSDGLAEEPKAQGTTYFILGNPNGALDLQIRSGKTGYRLNMAGQRSHLLVQARGGSGNELLTVRDAGTEFPSVTLRNTAGVQDYEVEFTQIIQSGQRVRSFKATKLAMTRNAPVELKVVENQTALEVTSVQSAVGYDLQLRSRTRKDEKVIEQTNIRLEAGKAQVFKPRSWLNLRKEDLQMQARPIRLQEEKRQ